MLNEILSDDSPLRQGRGSRKITRLKLLPVSWLKRMEAADDWRVLPLNFIVTYGYQKPLEIQVDKLPAVFAEQWSDDENGGVYTWQLSFSLWKDTPALVDWVDRFGKVGFIALLEAGPDECRVVGTKDFPLKIAQTAASLGGGSNTRGFTFGQVSTEPALFAESIDDDDLLF